MRIVALEGPSYAGKTTVVARVAAASPVATTLVFPCYVQEVLDRGTLPPLPARNADEQLAAFNFFMRIEGRRVERLANLIAASDRPDLVILDRSVDTNLAHVYAIDRLFGFNLYGDAEGLLGSLQHLTPDSTFYLDVPSGALRQRRARGGGEPGYFLHHAGFLGHTRDFFLAEPGPSPRTREVLVVPADVPPEQVVGAVVDHLLTVSAWSAR